MRTSDLVRLTFGSIVAHRLRSFLTMLGIVIGIASVILLTSIGEGTRQYILAEFAQFGSNLLQVQTGRSRTTGTAGVFGGTTNPLTLEDALALERVPGVEHVLPVVVGTGEVRASSRVGERSRDVYVYGVTDAAPALWKFGVRQGRFLPGGDPRQGGAVAVLGPKLKRELFGEQSALGEYVHIGGQRFIVIGVMEPKGFLLGFDIDDVAHIPIARAMPIFNRRDLMEINVVFSSMASSDAVEAGIRRILKERHRGEEDFTVTTQTEMLDTLNDILKVINYAVGGIAAISLLVGSIGILTMMWIAVNERTREIGLAKALGATERQILVIFLAEAALLSTVGGVLGLLVSSAISFSLHLFVPGLPLSTPLPFILLALGVSFAVGVASGVLPARRAALLDPVEALAAE